jgi:hypothetical protein
LARVCMHPQSAFVDVSVVVLPAEVTSQDTAWSYRKWLEWKKLWHCGKDWL